MITSAQSQRGLILIQQKRFAEAEKYFRDSLLAEPNDSIVLYYLALCEANQNRSREALDTLGRALALEPERADFHALRALILVDRNLSSEALAASAEAIRLDPDSDYAFVARASVLASRSEWSGAEAAARRALEINPDNASASNQLAHALRLQNRLSESAEQVDYMLAQDPERAGNHETAGWVALQRGDRVKAEQHFLEALRLDAHRESARAGLKEAFKARSPLYRAYLNYCFFMQRFTEGKRWLIFIGLIAIVKLAPLLGPAAFAIIVPYLLLVLWVHVARSVGNFQLFFDKFARHALLPGEKWDAWFAGGAIVAGIPLLAIGFVFSYAVPFILGLTLIGSAFPFAYTFTNRSPGGRFLFGAIGLFIYGLGAACLARLVGLIPQVQSFDTLVTCAAIAVVATTWLANVPALYRRK